jgi:hypothetical protein
MYTLIYPHCGKFPTKGTRSQEGRGGLAEGELFTFAARLMPCAQSAFPGHLYSEAASVVSWTGRAQQRFLLVFKFHAKMC